MMRGFFAFLALVIFLALPAPARPVAADPLIGLWGAQLDLGRSLRGELVIHKQARGWTASIAGKRATAVPAKDAIRFDFGRRGEFSGRLTGDRLEGYWIQPGDPAAAGALQPFATPLRLRRASPSEWRAMVVPLEQRFTLWLSIFRTPEGALTAAFRNPELNSNGGASRFGVTRNGNLVHFRFHEDQIDLAHDATLLRNPDRLRLSWPDIGRTLELVRKDPRDAASLFPRPPNAAPYVYHRPPQLSDGWRTARASTTGIDEAVLQNIVRDIAKSDPTARPPTLIHSILVAHRGRLVLEEYFFGYDRTTQHDLRSAGKTLASVMLGSEPARRPGLSPDSRITQVLASLGPFANPDPRKDQITLAHLLTHTSGLACNDNDDNSPGNEGTMQSQKAEPNWWRYTLNLPQLFDPGTRYAYCSANINLAGGALTHATDTWLPELFRRTVADPLQFGRWYWNVSADGEGYLGGGAFLDPRDLLKVGQAYLNGGTWNGRRIVPADWVRSSTAPRVDINPKTTGLSAEEFGNYYGEGKDGLAWHLGSLKAVGRTFPTYAAGGNGGQVLLVVPDADLVVVFTGGNYRQGGVWGRWGQQIVGDRIIPAIRKP